MKKNFSLPALAAIFLTALWLSGCGTVKIIVSDKSVSENETAVIYPYSRERGKDDGITLTLKSLDNKSLPQSYFTSNPVRIPAGEHTFTADAKWFSGLITVNPDPTVDPYREFFSAKNVQFTYNFKAGVSYYLEPVLEGGAGAKVTSPFFIGAFTGPKRVGGEPFIGKLAIYSVKEYDKQGLPVVSGEAPLEEIGFSTEVSF
jgi:hypothetical protein